MSKTTVICNYDPRSREVPATFSVAAPGLAVTPRVRASYVFVPGEYVITHVPSGRIVSYCLGLTRDESVHLMGMIGDLLDWTMSFERIRELVDGYGITPRDDIAQALQSVIEARERH